MRILILGAGVVGVSSAWHLLKDGHDVTVIDRALPAQGGASFGNAGLIAPGIPLPGPLQRRSRFY